MILGTTKTISLWLHRDEGDAWLVSRAGVGAGVFVPKSQVEFEDGHPLPILAPVGPLRCVISQWVAEEKGLVEVKDERQGELL